MSASAVDDDDRFTPRCVLVTGIPLTSKGQGLKRLLAGRCQSVEAKMNQASETEMQNSEKIKIIIRYNVHNHVRDGCCHILFPNASQAMFFMEEFECAPIDFEGNCLHVSFGASSLRDHFFPSLPFEVRRQMKLDPVATFSVTGEIASMRMGTLLTEGLARPFLSSSGSKHTYVDVLDATAGVGGNTIGLLRSIACSASLAPHSVNLHAAELDPQRFTHLVFNVSSSAVPYLGSQLVRVDTECDEKTLKASVARRVGSDVGCLFKNQCGFESCKVFLSDSTGDRVRILFFDPPWGGPAYAEKGEIEMEVSTLDGNKIISLSDMLIDLLGMNASSVAPNAIAVKLPSTYDFSRFAKEITDKRHYSGSANERHFPFKFHFDATMTLLVIVCNPFSETKARVESSCSSDHRGDFSCGNSFLDSVIEAINEWHGKCSQGEVVTGEFGPNRPWGDQILTGNGVCRPEFFDFEKERWIQVKKWISTSKRFQHAASPLDEISVQ